MGELRKSLSEWNKVSSRQCKQKILHVCVNISYVHPFWYTRHTYTRTSNLIPKTEHQNVSSPGCHAHIEPIINWLGTRQCFKILLRIGSTWASENWPIGFAFSAFSRVQKHQPLHVPFFTFHQLSFSFVLKCFFCFPFLFPNRSFCFEKFLFFSFFVLTCFPSSPFCSPNCLLCYFLSTNCSFCFKILFCF